VNRHCTITGHGKTIELDFELDPSVIAENSLLFYLDRQELPEPEVVDLMLRALHPGDFAIDGGANVGFFTLLMAKLVGETGQVWAFEPDASNRKTLEANIMLSTSRGTINVEIPPLWSHSGERVQFYSSKDGGASSLFECESCVGVEERWTTTLDRYVFGSTLLGEVRLIKLDIEGSEQHALEGATRILKAHSAYIVAELNEKALVKFACTERSIREFMHGFGYETFVLHGAGVIPMHIPLATRLVATRPNTNILFSTIDDVAALWPEVRI